MVFGLCNCLTVLVMLQEGNGCSTVYWGGGFTPARLGNPLKWKRDPRTNPRGNQRARQKKMKQFNIFEQRILCWLRNYKTSSCRH